MDYRGLTNGIVGHFIWGHVDLAAVLAVRQWEIPISKNQEWRVVISGGSRMLPGGQFGSGDLVENYLGNTLCANKLVNSLGYCVHGARKVSCSSQRILLLILLMVANEELKYTTGRPNFLLEVKQANHLPTLVLSFSI